MTPNTNPGAPKEVAAGPADLHHAITNYNATVSAALSDPPAVREGLTQERKAHYVAEICALGTGFAAPLFAIVEAIEAEVRASLPTKGQAVQAAEALDELRHTLCAVGIVGQVDGHDVIRRESVIDLIDRRRTA